MRILRINQVLNSIFKNFLYFLNSISDLAWEFFTPLHESNVVQLLAFFNIPFKEIFDDVLSNAAYLHAKFVAFIVILSRCSALDLTKYLVPLVLQHFYLAVLGSQFLTHPVLNDENAIHHFVNRLTCFVTFLVSFKEPPYLIFGSLHSDIMSSKTE